MPSGVPPFAIYDPGADTGANDSRRITVRAATVHTTEGNDSRGLGKNRHHNSPGTFNFLVRDEGVYCYYPADVRCSHAAGGNYAGPGIENEGFTGRPFSAQKLAHFGRLAHWLHDTYGVPITYKHGDPRIYLDQANFYGFIAHRAITYPPNPAFNHYDLLTPDEFARAVGTVPAPQPEPPKRKVPPTMFIAQPKKGRNVLFGDSYAAAIQDDVVLELVKQGVPNVGAAMTETEVSALAREIAKRNPTPEEIAKAIKG